MHYNNYTKIAIFVDFSPSWCFSIEAAYIAANQPMPVKQAKEKLVSGLDLVIQIIIPKFLQECTTILQLKVYIIYVVQKLVGHPMRQGDIK